jgi:hypothetical protein
MKRVSFLIFLTCLMTFLHTCRSKYEDCTQSDYDACITEWPWDGLVYVNITINAENREVPVEIFKGNFEDGHLIHEFTYRSRRTTVRLDTETLYSFTATYKKGDQTIVAVDGGEIKVIQYTMCEESCYEAQEIEIFLTID